MQSLCFESTIPDVKFVETSTWDILLWNPIGFEELERNERFGPTWKGTALPYNSVYSHLLNVWSWLVYSHIPISVGLSAHLHCNAIYYRGTMLIDILTWISLYDFKSCNTGTYTFWEGIVYGLGNHREKDAMSHTTVMVTSSLACTDIAK